MDDIITKLNPFLKKIQTQYWGEDDKPDTVNFGEDGVMTIQYKKDSESKSLQILIVGTQSDVREKDLGNSDWTKDKLTAKLTKKIKEDIFKGAKFGENNKLNTPIYLEASAKTDNKESIEKIFRKLTDTFRVSIKKRHGYTNGYLTINDDKKMTLAMDKDSSSFTNKVCKNAYVKSDGTTLVLQFAGSTKERWVKVNKTAEKNALITCMMKKGIDVFQQKQDSEKSPTGRRLGSHSRHMFWN